jgi:uncharacterized Zn finger protein (UPF0148 family)
MEYLVALVGLITVIGVPYLAVKRKRNPFLFLLLTFLIGPFAFIPLLKRTATDMSSSGSSLPISTMDNPKISIDLTLTSDNFVEPSDARVAACPSCGSVLAKIPGAKTKCPHCGAYMFIRTDPSTNSRVVVTAKRAEEIEDEWSKINGTWEERQEEKQRFAETKEELTQRFHGKTPSDNDIRWTLLNEDSIKNASMQNWGLYRNVIFQMGEILRKEDKHSAAIEKYLLVCYIDTCGPNNISAPIGQKSNSWGEIPFSESQAFLAPGVIERIQKSAKRINTDLEDLKEVLSEIGVTYKGAIPFTLSTEESWKKIIEELKKA